MANPEHLKILKQGVEQWNKWRQGDKRAVPDLSEANLTDGNLSWADLHQADLRRAYLGGADLSRAVLRSANLCQANVSGANLWRADLSWADLSQADFGTANLGGADLRKATLVEANLVGTDLSRANLGWANLRAASLSRANLDEANLSWADLSQADVTRAYFYMNQCVGTDFSDARGVPDYVLRMVGRPIEFYSCFISFSTKDQEFADRLYADLQNKGVRCWFAPHDIHSGLKIHEQIDDAIRMHDKLLLILSQHSMSSAWVQTEIANAREREEREKKQMLFPITLAPFAEVQRWKLFDADRGIDSAREVREYYIPDFSSWKEHDSYQRAFQRLVGDLKAETKSVAG